MKRPPWALWLALLLFVSSAAPVLGASASGDEGESPSTAEVPAPNAAEIAELEGNERERVEWLSSPEAIDQREASRGAFADLSADEARSLILETFPGQLSALNADPSRVLSDLEVEKPLGTFAALVSDHGERSLVESSVPVRSDLGGGDEQPVDLALEQSGGAFIPKNPLTDVQLPSSAQEPVQLPGGVEVDLPSNTDHSAQGLGDKNLFYPETEEATDTMVSPIAVGVEVFEQLRSPESPEEFRFDLNLPAGATLQPTEAGGAEVISASGDALVQVPTPTAVDAQGADVPVSMSVEGTSLLLEIPHRSRDLAYPLLLDPEYLEEGSVSYSQWSPAWNDAYNLSNTSSLLAQAKGNYTYGANTQGQWVYTAPGQTTFVAAAYFYSPTFTIPGNCEGKEPKNQPHGFAGLYNPSSNSYVGLGLWSGGSGSAPSYETKWVGYPGVRQAIAGIGTGNSSVSHQCAITFTVGGAMIEEKDPEAPTVDWVSDTSSGKWVKDLSIEVQASDPGLGVKGITLHPDGADPETKGGCTGTYTERCLSTASAKFGVGYFNDGERVAEITAFDPMGPDEKAHVSSSYEWTTRIDRGKPEVKLEGQLTEAIEKAEEKGEVGKGDVPQLSLPVYNLKIETTDGSNAEKISKRSGMKDIAVFVDGKEMEVPWEAQECPESSCSMTKTYPLYLNGLEGDPIHHLQVIAEDQVGNQRDQEVEFEYFPATGMKDEYVMQYFPLPDGEGNEDEEEHPRRPELAVNVVNGNLVYRQKDVDVEGPAVDLEVERFYNSQLPTENNTEWGDGWTLAQTPRLRSEEGQEEESDTASIVNASGATSSAVILPSEPEGEYFDPNLHAVVTKEPGGDYTIEDQNGETDTSLVFDSSGKVIEQRTSGYAKVEYSYKEGDLSELAVDDPASFGGAPPEEPLEGGQEAPAYLGAFGGSGSGPGTLAEPAGIATDSTGNAWVADTSHNRIQEFSPGGKFVRQFGAIGSGNGQLSAPRGLVFDSKGDLWVADSGNNRLQKFSPKGEYLAQFGTKGSGDGQLYVPRAVAIDSEDNLWVADTLNHRVQEFDSEGQFIRKFGTKGSGNGELSEPKGIAVDPEDNVWVADSGNHRIQAFDSEGEFIAAVGKEGTEDGQFSKPVGIAVDSEGNVWVADQGGDRIQEFDPKGEYLAQFGSPGNDSGQLSEPQGVAVDPEGNLWVADTDNDRVQEFATGEFILKFGGAGSEAGHLSYPNGIATDSKGNVWVADTSHHRIQEFDSEGKFIRQFGAPGTGPGQFSSPSAIAVDSEGNVWVADGGNHRVQEFDSEGKYLAQFGTSGSGNGQLSSFRGIATDAAGHVWVADTFNHRVQEFSSTGEFIRKFGTKGSGNGQFIEPKEIAVDGKEHVWVADTANHRIQEFSSTGEFIRAFGEKGSENGQLSSPAGLSLDAEGNVWVADTGNDRIQEFDSEGKYLAQFGATGNDAGQLSEPKGVATDAEGNVWVADTYNHRVQEFATGEFVRKFGGEGSEAGQLASPNGIAVDSEGNVWVADTSHHRIQEFDTEGEFIQQFGGKGSDECQLSSPRGIVLDAEGDIWVADSGNARIQEFGVDGACLSSFGSSGKGEGQLGVLGSLKDLAIDSAGHIWTVEAGLPILAPARVQEFSPEGEFIRAFGSEGAEDGQFSSPQGIAIDSKGVVWVADTGNHRIQRFDSEGQFLGTFGEEGTANGQLISPSNLAFSSDGHLWVADIANDRVQGFTAEGDYLAKFGSAGNDEGQLSQPRGIAVGFEGQIWLADTANNRVQKWQIPSYAPKHSSLYLSSFGSEGSAAGEFSRPSDIAVDAEGSTWVSDKSNHRIMEFDQAGEFVATFGKDVNQTAVEAEGSEAEKNLCTAASEDTCQAGEWGSADGQLTNPASVAIDAEGDIWVADKGNHRIEEFSPSGEYLSKFGSAGNGNGQLSQAEGIAIDSKGDIWVADTYNGRVQKFNQAGELLQVVGSYGTGEGQMGEPTGIDIGPGGNVWIADWQKNRVAGFTSGGEFIRQFGTLGSENGQFKHPDGLTIDDKGQIWVLDEGNDRVQSFTEAGEYLTQFGSTGSEEGEFNFLWPNGITTDSKGKLWVADAENNRVQRWGVYNYVAADESFVTDNDPKVEIETTTGLVESLEGEQAGQISYAHEGDLLSSVDGPAGETTYEYDEAERLTKVTLPNGTWGAISYDEATGRVKSVTVDPAGEDPAKTTYFSYQDSPSRRTTVSPEGEPATVYDIAADGSVFKWSNAEVPPEIANLKGSLTENLETAEPISPGDYSLLIEAHSAEGIASVEVIANGSTQVDEKTWEQDWETPEREHQTVEDLWVTETGNWSPGILNLEVIVTDADGGVTSQKFWVNIPYTPPPDPEADEPPKFNDVLNFREEFGLDLDLKGNELAIGERIFNLIGDWYNPNTPNGEVARATWARWGIPLRAVDATELEYRDRYVEQASNVIQQWVNAQSLTGSYAGYYVNHRQGGIIHVGFTSNQSALVGDLAKSGGLMAPSRIESFEFQPSHSLVNLASQSREFSDSLSSRPDIASLITGKATNVSQNSVDIKTSDVSKVNTYIEEILAPNAFTVKYQASRVSLDRQAVADPPRRVREVDSRLFVGDGISREWNSTVYGPCTTNFGAVENSGYVKPNGEIVWLPFALVAGHCFEINAKAYRYGRRANGELIETLVGTVTRSSYGLPVDEFIVDGAAISLNSGFNAPQWIWVANGYAQMTKTPTVPYPGELVCNAGVEGGSACGAITGVKEEYFTGASHPEWVWEAGGLHPIPGDSGGPVWDLRTGAALGIWTGGGRYFTPILGSSIEEGGEEIGYSVGALNAPTMGNLQIQALP